MAITELYSGTVQVSASASEFSLVTQAYGSGASVTTDGIIQVFLDLNELQNGNIYDFKIKEKITSGGTQRTVHYETLAHAQGAAPGYAAPALVLMHGWDATLTLTNGGGSAQSIGWSIRQIA